MFLSQAVGFLYARTEGGKADTGITAPLNLNNSLSILTIGQENRKQTGKAD